MPLRLKLEACYFLLERISGEIEEGPEDLKTIQWELESRAQDALEFGDEFAIDDFVIVGPTHTAKMDVDVNVAISPIVKSLTAKKRSGKSGST